MERHQLLIWSQNKPVIPWLALLYGTAGGIGKSKHNLPEQASTEPGKWSAGVLLTADVIYQRRWWDPSELGWPSSARPEMPWRRCQQPPCWTAIPAVYHAGTGQTSKRRLVGALEGGTALSTIARGSLQARELDYPPSFWAAGAGGMRRTIFEVAGGWCRPNRLRPVVHARQNF